ncbi:MAG: hypothetical protein H0X42_01620 [Solirubrobacterales bacterium]|nr:hypothetical protein [Solirubrobacterales bacterium]
MSRARALRVFSGAGLALVLAILIAAPVSADSVGNARYEYKVTGFDYKAIGLLDASKFNTAACTPEDQFWSGRVITNTADAELSQLDHGSGKAEIHEHGTDGEINVVAKVFSKFFAAHHETTACDEYGSVSNFTSTPCTDEEESTLRANVEIRGGVGTSVKVNWSFSTSGEGSLVPNNFECVKQFKFPDGGGSKCSRSSKSSDLTVVASPTLKLPFRCLGKTMVPPPGSEATRFGSTVTASGALYLKRVRQSP